MHTTEDRRKVVMLRIDRAFPFDSCCGKPDAFNPESILSAVTRDLSGKNQSAMAGFQVVPELAEHAWRMQPQWPWTIW